MAKYAVLFCLILLNSVQAAPEQEMPQPAQDPAPKTAPIQQAAPDKVSKVSSMSEAPVGAAELANITLALFFVLALIFVLAWLFRRYGNIATLNKSNIQVLGGVSLGHRERAVLIEVEGERILVGVAQGNVTRLHVLKKSESNETDEVDIESDQASDISTSDISSGFAEKLKQVIKPANGEKQ